MGTESNITWFCRGRSRRPKHPIGRRTWKLSALGELKALNPFTPDWLHSAWKPVKLCTPVHRDHVEISPLGQMLDGISQLPEIRYERVEEIRQQIAAGSYETPEKLELALDRLLDEFRGW